LERSQVLRLNERILELEKENEALKKRLSLARGVPAEVFIADLAGGERTKGYKDRYDVITKSGLRIEVKQSHLNSPGSTKTKRWNWDRLLGLNATKKYDLLALVGDKDHRYEAQYPELEYVCFLVPRRDVDTIKSNGNCIALNTNLKTARACKSQVLIRYLVRSREHFTELIARAAVS
jgi:hypothetical protein